jgi:MFS family permease
MNRTSAAIYTAGLLQGMALVAFPAVSTLLTDPALFDFSNTQYGSLFIPQAVLSIGSAALNPALCRRLGAKRVYTLGLVANFVSMALLALSALLMHSAWVYALFLVATGCLGIGFGVVVPTINRMIEELYPLSTDQAVLILNALLGVGTALAPVIVAMIFWWWLPLLMAVALALLIFWSQALELPEETHLAIISSNRYPGLFWIFALFAFLYGIIETLNGNWVSIFMRKHMEAPLKVQSLALTAFWGMVTFGRVFFAKMSRIFSEQVAFQMAPFLTTGAFLVIGSLSPGQESWAIAAFGLTGFGCSILLPLMMSFGGKQLSSVAASVPGMIISFYLLGYGVSAFGVGPLEEFAHVNLRAAYVIGAGISFILGLLSLYIIAMQKKSVRRS